MTLSLKIVNPDTLAELASKTATLPFNANASVFCSIIADFQTAYKIFNNTPKCEQKYLDLNLNELPSSALTS